MKHICNILYRAITEKHNGFLIPEKGGGIKNETHNVISPRTVYSSVRPPCGRTILPKSSRSHPCCNTRYVNHRGLGEEQKWLAKNQLANLFSLHGKARLDKLMEIPSTKNQTPNKSQLPKVEIRNRGTQPLANNQNAIRKPNN